MHRQYIPITEAVCAAVGSLNAANRPATFGAVLAAMQAIYPGAPLPNEEVMESAVSALTATGQLYCAGDRYYVAAAGAPQFHQLYYAGADNLATLGAPFNVPQYAAALANPAVYHQMAIALQHQYTTGGGGAGGNELHAQRRMLRDAAPYYVPSAPAMKTTECQTGASVCDVPPVRRPQQHRQPPNSARPPPAVKQSMCTQTRQASCDRADSPVHTEPVDEQHATLDRQGRVCAGAGGKDKDSLKPGFFARLFSSKRQKSKDKCAHQQKSAVPKSRTVDANIHKESAGKQATVGSGKPPAGPSGGHKAHKQAAGEGPAAQCSACGHGTLPRQAEPQLDTFSAQFPPSEWLPDARLANVLQQQACSSGAQPSVPGLALFRTRPQAGPAGGQIGKRSSCRASRQPPGAPTGVQRYCMFPENLAGGGPTAGGGYSPKLHMATGVTPLRSRERHGGKSHRSKAADYNRREIQQRLSKYLSSSSECLQFLGPVDPPELLPSRCYAELEGIMYGWERRPSKQGGSPPPPQHKSKTGAGGSKSSKLPRSEAMRFHGGEAMIKGDLGHLEESYLGAVDEHDRTPLAKCGTSRRGSKQPCCTLELDASNEMNSTLDYGAGSGGQRTSTPDEGRLRHGPNADDPSDAFYQSMPTLSAVRVPQPAAGDPNQDAPADGHPTGDRLRPESTGDSALSASPVVTELSSGGPNSNKYSSWSGSEGNNQPQRAHPPPPPDNSEESAERPDDDTHINHTYINLDHRAKEIPYQDKMLGRDLPSADKTYENVGASNSQATYQTLGGDVSDFTSVTDVESRQRPPKPADKPKASAYISAV